MPQKKALIIGKLQKMERSNTINAFQWDINHNMKEQEFGVWKAFKILDRKKGC